MTFFSIRFCRISSWILLIVGVVLFVFNVYSMTRPSYLFTHGILTTYMGTATEQKPVSLPFSDPFPSGLYKYTLRMDLSRMISLPTRLHIIPDDCATVVVVNGVDVPLTSIPPADLCDYRNGFVIDLGAWLHSGDNTLLIDFQNTGGPASINVRYEPPLWQALTFAISILLILEGLLSAKTPYGLASIWRVLPPWLLPCMVSTLLVYAGVVAGVTFLRHGTCTGYEFDYHGEWYANWDGQWYKYILMKKGYDEAGLNNSPIVFFPLYPLLGAVVYSITGFTQEFSLLIVTLVSLALFARQWRIYGQIRLDSVDLADNALLFVLFCPASYFLRMTYTESLYLFLLTVLLYGFVKRWPLYWLIAIAGLITATRSQGIAAAFAVGVHVWRRDAGMPCLHRVFRMIMYTGLSAWGLIFFMCYQWAFHGSPFLFLDRQKAWGSFGWGEGRIEDLLVFRPLWEFFTSGGWRNPGFYPRLLLDEGEWLSAVVLLILGIYKRWLIAEEIVVATLTLGIAYITERWMSSVGRYSILALPCFLVLARALKQPRTVMLVIAVLSALMFLNAGMFAMWYCVY